MYFVQFAPIYTQFGCRRPYMYVLGGVNPVHWTASTQFILCISQSQHKAREGAYTSARRHSMVRRKDHSPRINVKEQAACPRFIHFVILRVAMRDVPPAFSRPRCAALLCTSIPGRQQTDTYTVTQIDTFT